MWPAVSCVKLVCSAMNNKQGGMKIDEVNLSTVQPFTDDCKQLESEVEINSDVNDSQIKTKFDDRRLELNEEHFVNLELQSTFRTDKSERLSLIEESNEKKYNCKSLKNENNEYVDVIRNKPVEIRNHSVNSSEIDKNFVINIEQARNKLLDEGFLETNKNVHNLSYTEKTTRPVKEYINRKKGDVRIEMKPLKPLQSREMEIVAGSTNLNK